MANQIVIPAIGAGATFAPQATQPASSPYNSGDPPEGPRSALVSMAIPAGQTRATSVFTISQFNMSMLQSILVDNEANSIPITITVADGVNFGIQPFGTQVIPVFTAGTNVSVTLSIAEVQPAAIVIALQLFNNFVQPASWVSNLSVSGNVNVAAVGGDVNVTVSGANILGVGLTAQPTGGASAALIVGMTNTVIQINPAPGATSFKGGAVISGTAGFIQLFDVSTPGLVTLGTTPPNVSIPVGPANQSIELPLPPEGIMFANGLMAAWTTTVNGAVAPANALNGTLFYA